MAESNNRAKRKSSLQQKVKPALDEGDIHVVDTRLTKKAVIATATGNAMEWFDFGIYSYLASTIGKLFYPDMSGPTQLVFAFATFAIAFLIRPIGGMFFGMLGDRWGRKRTLVITLILMACATLSIGLLPTFASIGALAPILLLVARLLQGFSTGGEYSGAMTFIAESSPDKKRGVMASGLEVGTLCGYVMGSGIITLLTFILGSETMLDWGWRIPFLIAAPIGMIGLYLRSHLEETPAFQALKEKQQQTQYRHVGIKGILTRHRKPLLVGLMVVFFYNIILYMVMTYMPSHLSAVLGYGETTGLLLILIVMVIMIPIVIFMGYFADRIGSKRVIQGGLVGTILFAIPAFLLIGSGHNILVFLGVMILGIFLASFQGSMPSLLPSLFFTDIRYETLSISYNVSTSLFGGTAPLLVSWLVNELATRMVGAYYMVFVSLVGMIVVSIFVRDSSGKPLRGSPPVVEKQEEVQEVLQNTDKGLWWEEDTTTATLGTDTYDR